MWCLGCWVEYRQVGCHQDLCPSLPEQVKEYILKKGSAGGAPTLGPHESVWLDSLFPLLTVVPGKSAPERCWMAVLSGCCCWGPCRSQRPKYKHSSPLGPLTWHHYHLWCTCLSSAELPKRQRKRGSVHQFHKEHRISSLHSGSAGFVYAGWDISSPVAKFCRQSRCISIARFEFHPAAWGPPQIQKPADGGTFNIQ